jgi:hypothetical protein
VRSIVISKGGEECDVHDAATKGPVSHAYSLPHRKTQGLLWFSNLVCTDVGVCRSMFSNFPHLGDAPAALKPTHSIANADCFL